MTEKPRHRLPSDAEASGRSFGAQEMENLRRVIDSGILNCTKGTLVKTFETRFSDGLGVGFCRAVSSGTAAVHTAVAAIDPEPGDEIITTPITDMGGITPILYQTAIPVFADVDPRTYNVTAEAIDKKITRRTRAVIVTHLFGTSCDMDPILELCQAKGLPVIEDCAQAYGVVYRGRPVGTMGAIGCFSMQQGKHLSSGEGGFVVTSDRDLARRMTLFVDKAWGYGDPAPDHYFLALNYRMTELQGAVALAQLEKLSAMIRRRVEMAEALTEGIRGIPGVSPPASAEGSNHTYWKYALRIDPERIEGGTVALGAKLKEAGIFCSPRYIQKPAFECQVLRERKTFGSSEFPFKGDHRRDDPPVVYRREDTPGAIEALSTILVLPINEKYTPADVEFVASNIREAATALLIGDEGDETARSGSRAVAAAIGVAGDSG